MFFSMSGNISGGKVSVIISERETTTGPSHTGPYTGFSQDLLYLVSLYLSLRLYYNNNTLLSRWCEIQSHLDLYYGSVSPNEGFTGQRSQYLIRSLTFTTVFIHALCSSCFIIYIYIILFLLGSCESFCNMQTNTDPFNLLIYS